MNNSHRQGTADRMRPPYSISLFRTDFSFEERMDLRRHYDRSEPLPIFVTHRTDKITDASPLSFGCNITQEQMTGIQVLANDVSPVLCRGLRRR